jgi:hypothetical protein
MPTTPFFRDALSVCCIAHPDRLFGGAAIRSRRASRLRSRPGPIGSSLALNAQFLLGRDLLQPDNSPAAQAIRTRVRRDSHDP